MCGYYSCLEDPALYATAEQTTRGIELEAQLTMNRRFIITYFHLTCSMHSSQALYSLLVMLLLMQVHKMVLFAEQRGFTHCDLRRRHNTPTAGTRFECEGNDIHDLPQFVA